MSEPNEIVISRQAKKAKISLSSKNERKSEEIEYLEEYNKLKQQWPEEMGTLFSSSVEDDRRSELFHMMCFHGDILRQRYSWAIPDERALKAVAQFAPIVEVGCGQGYWAKLLRERGVDITAYDILASDSASSVKKQKGEVEKGEHNKKDDKGKHNKKDGDREDSEDEEQISFWTEVQPGGPEVLAEEGNKGRNLFLCYPDDYEESEESLALNCLKKFTGDYVIHVGELFGHTLSCRQAPWGRTSDPNFQEQLNSTFHQILQLSLPQWPHSQDMLTVWKRTKAVPVDLGDDEQETEDSDKQDQDAPITSHHEDIWADIPSEERIPLDFAAPCVLHLI